MNGNNDHRVETETATLGNVTLVLVLAFDRLGMLRVQTESICCLPSLMEAESSLRLPSRLDYSSCGWCEARDDRSSAWISLRERSYSLGCRGVGSAA